MNSFKRVFLQKKMQNFLKRNMVLVVLLTPVDTMNTKIGTMRKVFVSQRVMPKMLANSEFIIMLNQASTDRLELAKLLNISDLQMSYITNVEAGHGLIKVGSSLVPFANKFPKNTKLYKLMTTKPGESA